jgi:hypothetical protein
LAIRLVNGYGEHWKYGLRGGLEIFEVEPEQPKKIKVDMKDMNR